MRSTCYRPPDEFLDSTKYQLIQPSSFFHKEERDILSMYIDYRVLNTSKVIDVYPIQHIGNVLDCLGGSVVFNKIDLA